VSLVLDASMTIAWLFRDERTQLAQSALRRVAIEGALVPAIWRLEVANVLRNAVRRGRCDDQYAERSLQRLGRLRITVDSETDRQAWGRDARAFTRVRPDAVRCGLSRTSNPPAARAGHTGHCLV